ncbi:MAG: type II toxin-antitoxin system PemK/MazF family toxin [Alkalibacterium sp.]|uniref:mRNA interferase MazF n=1 Tax=Alkalibacterium gilvum TaxID=1130080 RepID=A0A1H6S130_9LACT|nr:MULTISPECIES: type II toxin-antitoxin system PemK/MazF family toxin [Alkalibacterium]MDN6193804.1 type II toxin-antitoxin system PemK/MazF family toxin [Alkalibacterium sp.]MDN6294674.1 type II toxin-antitoxin system PemK/MazF family toxin [Alkalibacterium sp.]MDN6295873.1 type II toxin-antitoxin system PemK/MazF family toxin [Alkalibacterium sp.]MDN6326748.1 type II toxin-antitoxin system PemK/MazF family toxin [Alkalibacterium sp.]MDN6398005.1 type II toxin-antitoxin system PemK/MazF fami
MKYEPKQRDIVIIDFEPSKGYEIKKRRPALILSRDEYNVSTNMIIVCPITSTNKKKPFLVPITVESLSAKYESKVNTNQVYSLDYSERANRNVQFVETLEEEQFYRIAQKFLYNFAFQL